MNGLRASLAYASRDLAVQLSVAPGEVLALIGPNGAGKSTALALLAGLLDDRECAITLNGRELTGVAVHRRRVSLLSQEPLLFPRLSVLDNVAFAPRCAGASRAESRSQARGWLERLDLAAYADRKPRQLSGGQAQRVAIARALAADPELLLLDEPLAALDADAAPGVRRLLREVLRTHRRTTIAVTHDLLDALALADRVCVLEAGRCVESGPVNDVLTAPRSAFGARFAGINLVSGRFRRGALHTGQTRIGGLGTLADDAAAVAVFRPAAVAIHPQCPQASPRNALHVELSALDVRGDTVRVSAEHPDCGTLYADVTPAAVAELGLNPGSQVWFVVKAQEVQLLAR